MKYEFEIQRSDMNEVIAEHLKLEHALALWRIQGYEHPEYKIVMKPSREFYIYVEDLDQIEVIDPGQVNRFKIRQFMYLENHESDS